jgi:hypothetical protein
MVQAVQSSIPEDGTTYRSVVMGEGQVFLLLSPARGNILIKKFGNICFQSHMPMLRNTHHGTARMHR